MAEAGLAAVEGAAEAKATVAWAAAAALVPVVVVASAAGGATAAPLAEDLVEACNDQCCRILQSLRDTCRPDPEGCKRPP